MNQPTHGRHVVVTEIDRADSGVIDELGRAGTATVHEAIGRRGFEVSGSQRDFVVAGFATVNDAVDAANSLAGFCSRRQIGTIGQMSRLSHACLQCRYPARAACSS